MKTTANYFPVPGQQFRLTLGGGHVGVDVSGPLRLTRWARGLDGDDGPQGHVIACHLGPTVDAWGAFCIASGRT